MMDKNRLDLEFTRVVIMSGLSFMPRPPKSVTVDLIVPSDIRPDTILNDREWIEATTHGDARENKAHYISFAEEPDKPEPPQMKWIGDV